MTTTELSIVLTSCLTAIKSHVIKYSGTVCLGPIFGPWAELSWAEFHVGRVGLGGVGFGPNCPAPIAHIPKFSLTVWISLDS